MEINPAFGFSDIVYLKTDIEQLPRMVTAYTVSPGKIRYELVSGITSTWHDEIEISTKKSKIIQETEIAGIGK